jgi:RHS repeat-associated protein
MLFSRRVDLFVASFIAGLLIGGASSPALAQTYNFDTRPARGFMPTADQVTTPMDSIDAVNGNLHLQVPLASMPKGRAGWGFDLDLVYDSHLYDVVVEQDYQWLNNQATTGGWNYNFHNAKLEGEIKPLAQCQTTNEQPYFRLRIGLPDGSMHVLHHIGEPFANDGFYRLDAAGKPFALCTTLGPVSGWQSYYTTDGSFLRLQIFADGSPDWWTKQWWLTFADGRKAVGTGDKLQRLYDANGNGIYFNNYCDDMDCDMPWTVILDDTNPGDDPANPARRVRVNFNVTDAVFETDTAMQDTITTTSPGGATATWTINWMVVTLGGPGTTRTYPKYDCSATIPDCSLYMRHWTVKYIQLPLAPTNDPPVAWNSYEFRYSDDNDNGFGELNYARMPGGAVYSYQYRLENFFSDTESIALYNSVAQKTVTHDGSDSPLTWTYSFSDTTSTFANPDGGQITHLFNDRRGVHNWARGLVTRIDEPLGSVRKRVWAQNKVSPGSASVDDPNNPYIQKETVTVGNAAGTPSKTAVVNYTLDKNGNQTQRIEYNWVTYAGTSIENGTTIQRATTMLYHLAVPTAASTADDPNAYWNTTAPPRLDAVWRREISDGSAIKAITEFYYDDATANGNVETEKRWDSLRTLYPPAPGNLAVWNAEIRNRRYDPQGNLTDILWPEVPVHFSYDTYGNYPIQVKYGYNTTEERTWTYSWDNAAGVLNSKTDADNNIITSYTYDIVGRRLTTTEAGMRRTLTIYDDQNQQVIVKRDLAAYADGKLQTITQYDELGRVRKVRTSDGTPLDMNPAANDGIKVTSTYRMGAGARVVTSTPYRNLTDPTLEWTCTQQDRLGRSIAIAMFSGSIEPTDCQSTAGRTANTAPIYDSDRTQVTDPAGKRRDQYRDVIGHIIKVVEAPTTLNYTTNYQYDVLDNLRQVTQADGSITQTRTFTYSSIGHLLSAVNPESGLVRYTYDPDTGDLVSRADDRGFLVTYTYDGLHRIKSKDYVEDGNVTPDVTYEYYTTAATAPNKGQLKSVTSSAATATYSNYDALGRFRTNTQQMSGNAATYTLRYTYWLSDEWKTLQYPSGRLVTFGADDAGRVNKVTAGGKIYADLTQSFLPPAYYPDGRVAWLKFGNDLWATNDYHTPGTATLIKLGTSEGIGDKSQLEYNYSATTNNGNLLSHLVRRGGTDFWFQEFTYDDVNRLIVAKEYRKNRTSNPTQWSHTNSYDRFGNRWVSTNGLTYADTHEPASGSNFNKNTNRLNGLAYDAAGNLSQYNPYTLSYDAENRLITMTSPTSGNSSFSYDGGGRRVRRTWTPNGGTPTTTYYVYDASGRLATEYTTMANPPGDTVYLFTDLLGSVRAVSGEKPTSGTASVTECYDYVDFGRLLSASDNTRPSCYQPNPENSLTSRAPEKFTGHLRDAVPLTNLDYFGARYYSGAQGRFTSADSMSGALENPQSWNKYAYTFNNPLRYVDSNGKWPTAIHNGIIAGAFLEMSREHIRLIQGGSFAVDFSLFGQTLSSYAYQHGMMAPGESADEAAAEMRTFVDEHLEKAVVWQDRQQGIVAGNALTEFGKAVHPVMDRMSPAHANQVFEGVPSNLRNLSSVSGIAVEVLGALAHSSKEKKISRNAYEKSVDEVRKSYLKTFGKAAFSKATGCEKVEGCAYDYTVLGPEYWED